MAHVDYDRLSCDYDRRYRVSPLVGVERALLGLVAQVEPALSLEVGCGTGWWLPTLMSRGGAVIGLDAHLAMLTKASPRRRGGPLLCADGDRLPFRQPGFDLVVSINAIHHFAAPGRWLRACHRCLRPGGHVAIVHFDPAREGQAWYAWDYFEGTRGRDLARFPRTPQICDWMERAGFVDIDSSVAESIERHYSGREVLDDYFLGRDSNSTLAGLSQRAYEAGLLELRRDIDRHEERGESLRLEVRLQLVLLSGRRDAG